MAPSSFFDLYDEDKVSVPPSPNTTEGLPPIAFFTSVEALTYKDWSAEAKACGFKQTVPMPANVSRRHRRAYFASLSYTDHLVGSILAALDASGRQDVVVALWADVSLLACCVPACVC